MTSSERGEVGYGRNVLRRPLRVLEGNAELTEKHSLIHVKYVDHVLFRNADPNLFNPTVREAIGWIVKENDEALWICFDRPIDRLPCEKPDSASGLVIIKSDILERKEIG